MTGGAIRCVSVAELRDCSCERTAECSFRLPGRRGCWQPQSVWASETPAELRQHKCHGVNNNLNPAEDTTDELPTLLLRCLLATESVLTSVGATAALSCSVAHRGGFLPRRQLDKTVAR